MGDDDTIEKGSVERLVNILKNNIDFLVLNSVPYDKELAIQKYPKAIDCLADKKYISKDIQNLLIDLKKWSYNGFMSAMIIRRSLIEPLIPKYKDPNFSLYDTSWLPLAIFYEAILNRIGLFICEPSVLSRPNPRTFTKSDWVYSYLERYMAIDYLKEIGYDRKILKNVVKSGILGFVSSRIQVI